MDRVKWDVCAVLHHRVQKDGGLFVCLNAFDNPSSRRIGTQDKSDEI